MSEITDQLGALVKERGEEITTWISGAYAKHPPFFYASVDLRHSGHKLAPVDTNLFPAGFNNLSEAARSKGVEAIRAYVAERCPEARHLLIVPEDHSRNVMYFENLRALMEMIEAAGLDVRLGSVSPELKESREAETASGAVLKIEPALRRQDRLQLADGFAPDLILVNNDFSSGCPESLRGLEQPVTPPPGMGWYRRRKSEHFAAYREVVEEFSKAFAFDPWRIAAVFHECGKVDFKQKEGIECVALGVDKVLHQVRRKYEEYGITETPYVFVKADQGTYGMGIMTVESGEELYEINKKLRNKMHRLKGGSLNTNVMIQEGVPTVDHVQGSPAEPMLYLINGQSLGGAYRYNPERNERTNLNAAGMAFSHLCDEPGNRVEREGQACAAFCLVARLASVAAAREHHSWQAEIKEKAEQG